MSRGLTTTRETTTHRAGAGAGGTISIHVQTARSVRFYPTGGVGGEAGSGGKGGFSKCICTTSRTHQGGSDGRGASGGFGGAAGSVTLHAITYNPEPIAATPRGSLRRAKKGTSKVRGCARRGESMGGECEPRHRWQSQRIDPWPVEGASGDNCCWAMVSTRPMDVT